MGMERCAIAALALGLASTSALGKTCVLGLTPGSALSEVQTACGAPDFQYTYTGITKWIYANGAGAYDIFWFNGTSLRNYMHTHD